MSTHPCTCDSRPIIQPSIQPWSGVRLRARRDVRTVRSAGRWFSLLAWLWFAGAGTGIAQPEDPNVVRARELFKLGVDAYDRGSYTEALQSFQQAYQLRPHPAVRVNIAN